MDEKGRPTTIEEVEAIPRNTLLPKHIARVLNCDPYLINCACKAGTLPWAVQMKSRTVISKEAFIFWYKYGSPVVDVSFKRRDEDAEDMEEDYD